MGDLLAIVGTDRSVNQELSCLVIVFVRVIDRKKNIVGSNYRHREQQNRMRKHTTGGNRKVVLKILPDAFAKALEIRRDPAIQTPKLKRNHLAHVSEDYLQVRIFIEHAFHY